MTPSEPHIIVVGESLIDCVEGPHGMAEHVGGSPANVALGLGRLGHSVELYTQFGRDRLGRLIQHHLEETVQIVQGGAAGTPTSTARVELDSQGVPTYYFDLTWDVRFPSLPSSSVLHTGSLGAYLDPGHDEVLRLVREQAGDATITLDPNLRPGIMDRATAKERLSALIPLADVVKVSDEDLNWLYPGNDPAVIATGWLTEGARLVVLTRGEHGADAWTAASHVTVSASATRVIDTVGAGDSFMAGLIDALCSLDLVGSTQTPRLGSIKESQLRAIMMHAANAASITVGRAGAQPPTRDELGWCGED